MKSIGSQGARIIFLLVLVGAVICMPPKACGQLVEDGSTNILDGVSTNLLTAVYVGSNAPFTMLVLTNGTTVTNVNGGCDIGWNTNANSNTVIVVGAGTVWTNFAFRVGFNGSYNRLSILDGAVVSGRDLGLAENLWANNNLAVISGAGSLCTNSDLTYISSGSGNQLIITNGGAVAGRIAFIYGNSNSVAVTGTNSTWKCASLEVGRFGAGFASYNQLLINNGGTVSISGTGTVGTISQSNFIFVADPGSSFRSGTIVLGHGSRGNQLVVSNGAVVAANHTYVEDNSGSNSQVIVTGSGSLLTNQSDFQLGQRGSSNLLMLTDGGTLADNSGYIGNFIASVGNLAIIDGPHSLWTNRGDFYAGYTSPRNQLIISNGAKLFDASGYVGFNSASNTVIVTSPESLWTNRSNFYVGNGGANNQLIITNGGTVISPNSYIGAPSSGLSNKVVVTDPGSLWKTLQTLSIGTFGNGANQLIVSNSGTVLASTLTVNVGSFGFKMLISGGNLIVTNSILLLGPGPGFFTLDSGLVAADYLSCSQTTFDFRAGTLQLHSSQFFGTSPFNVGNGVAQATLELLNYGSHNFNSHSLVVSSNATLKGVGTILANVTISDGATISPSPSWGSSVGSMIIGGDLLLSPGSTNLMGLNGEGNFAKYDYFVGISNMTYGGTLLLTNITGQLAAGNSFRLYSASNYSGAFSSIIPPSPGPGLKWNTNELNVDGVLRVVALQPLPPTIAGQLSGTNFQIRASGGIPYDPCYLLTTTNIVSPAGWEYYATNTFDSSGNAVFNPTFLLDEKERFFRLQVQ